LLENETIHGTSLPAILMSEYVVNSDVFSISSKSLVEDIMKTTEHAQYET
jgi:hypothetical protein